MDFTHIFLFTVTSKSFIDINAISIFNNLQSMNPKAMKIIKIQLFVNNVAYFTAYLANARKHACFLNNLISIFIYKVILIQSKLTNHIILINK